MKKTIQLLLGFCLVLALLIGAGAGVAAATAESVWVNGVQMVDGDYLETNVSTTVTPGATAEPASYVAWYRNGTLTLKDAEIVNGSEFTAVMPSGEAGICSYSDLSIVLIGDNTVKASSDEFIVGIGVCAKVSISSSGAGSLTVTGAKAGIYTLGNSITICGNANVSAASSGLDDVILGYGAIYASGGSVIMCDEVNVMTDIADDAPYANRIAEVYGSDDVIITGDVTLTIDENSLPSSISGICGGFNSTVSISDGAIVKIKGVNKGISDIPDLIVENAVLVISEVFDGISYPESITINRGILSIIAEEGQVITGDHYMEIIDCFLSSAAYRDHNTTSKIEITDFSKISFNDRTETYIYGDNPYDKIYKMVLLPYLEHELFIDYEAWSWAQPYVAFVIENGIMGSVYSGSKYFDSNGSVTRGMMVTVLYRLSGSPALTEGDYAAYNGKFSDVAKGQWYYDAVVWANKNGVTTGVADTSFAPDGKVTREQLVTFFFRFGYLYHDNPDTGATLSKYKDQDQIASYAVPAFRWAYGLGIVNGTSSTTLSPKATCTRGQMAKIITVFSGVYLGDRDWIRIAGQ